MVTQRDYVGETSVTQYIFMFVWRKDEQIFFLMLESELEIPICIYSEITISFPIWHIIIM